MKPIAMLSGPVGAGKTTIARELVAAARPPLAYLEGDVFWGFIAKAAPRRRTEDFKTIMRALLAAGVSYAISGFDVLVDFTIPPWFLDSARKIAAVRDVPLDYIVVQPSERACAARAAARARGAIADYTRYSDLYADFDDLPERHLIRDDTATAGELAARIRAGLAAGTFRL